MSSRLAYAKSFLSRLKIRDREAMTPQRESPRTKRARLGDGKEVNQAIESNGAMNSVDPNALPRTDVHLPPPSDQPLWQQVIAEAVKSIVSIRFSQVASFDTEAADTSEGAIIGFT